MMFRNLLERANAPVRTGGVRLIRKLLKTLKGKEKSKNFLTPVRTEGFLEPPQKKCKCSHGEPRTLLKDWIRQHGNPGHEPIAAPRVGLRVTRHLHRHTSV